VQLKLLLATLLLTIASPVTAVLEPDAKRVFTEAQLLTSLAGDYTTIEQPERAIQLLEEALSLNQAFADSCPRLWILANVAGHYAFLGQETKSSALFAQAQKIIDTTEYCGAEPSSSDSSVPGFWVASAAASHADEGRQDIALRIATSFGDKHLEYTLLGLKFRYSGDSGQSELVAQVNLKLADYYNRTGKFDRIRSQSSQDRAQTELYRCLVRKEARAFSSVWRITETLDRTQLAQVLNICQGVELTEQATEVPTASLKALEQIVVAAQERADPIARSRTLTAVADLYALLEKNAEAAELLNKALPDLQAATDSLRRGADESPGLDFHSSVPKDLPPDEQSQWTSKIRDATSGIEELISGYLNIGRLEQALEIARRLQTGELYLGVNFNYAYERVMPRIVAAYAKAGLSEQAFQLADNLRDRGSAVVSIAEQYASLGQYQQAIETAVMIKSLESRNKASVIYDIIEGAIKAGKLDWALQATQSIDWTVHTTQAFGIGQTIDEATNESRYYRNELLLAIARDYAKLRQFDSALKAANMISSDEVGNSRKAKALSAIAREYAEVGRTEEAAQLLAQSLEIARSISPQ
jgi:tetratricopeptide (TPR) repeat protein